MGTRAFEVKRERTNLFVHAACFLVYVDLLYEYRQTLEEEREYWYERKANHLEEIESPVIDSSGVAPENVGGLLFCRAGLRLHRWLWCGISRRRFQRKRFHFQRLDWERKQHVHG